MARSICLSRAINADAAQAIGRGIGIERLGIVKDVENQRGPPAVAIADDIKAGSK